MCKEYSWPPALLPLAEVLGPRRNANNRESNEATGTVREDGDIININGALCELIILNHLMQIGKPWVANKIFDDGYQADWDFIYGEKRVDVKYCGGYEMHVNEKSHQKHKADLYWFVKPDRERHTFRCVSVTWEEVNDWQMKKRHSEYRCKPWPEAA
jgi:hypothetical protein